jgi:tetratricopeptide (TPR) repeat protein
MQNVDLTRTSTAPIAWLALAPALALAAPTDLWLSRFDPDPAATATGLVLLGLLPAAFVAATRGSIALRHVAVLVLPLVVWLAGANTSDTFEARRAAVQAAVIAVGFVVGASLDGGGRAALVRATATLGLVHAGAALLAALFGSEFELAGRLGNVGPTNHVALVGGLAGAWLAAHERGGARVLGAAAFLAFVLHAVFAPVLAGLLAAALVVGGAALVAPWARVNGRASMLGVAGALVVLFALVASFGGRGESGVVATPTAVDASSHLGGATVRLLVWQTLPTVVARGGVLGAGPGQFAAVYPPHRDARERAASGADTTVEHPHQDWFLVWVEYGWLGGAAATAILALVAATAWRTWRARVASGVDGALAAAVFGALAAALAHSALLGNAASGLAAAVGVGALRARRGDGVRAPEMARFTPLAVVLLGAWPALALSRHGVELAAATRVIAHANQRLDAGTSLHAMKGVQRALGWAPTSVLANDMLESLALAYLATGIERDRFLALAANASERQCAARPNSPTALVDRGLIALLGGNADEARLAWSRAIEIAPDHPTALANLARLELSRGDALAGRELLDRLAANGRLVGDERRALVRSLLAAGLEPARAALALELDPSAPSEIHAVGMARSDDLAKGIAQHLWARQFLDANDVDSAVVSLRQAVRAFTNDGSESALARVELAGAEYLAGRAEAARNALAALPKLDPHAPPLPVHARLVDAVRALLEG